MKQIFSLLLSTVIFLLSGCGYTLVGQGSLPEHIKKIAVPTFVNTTLEEGVEEVITRVLINEYVKGGKIKLVAENEADAILRGTIRSYKSREAVAYNERNEVSTYRVTVVVDIELKDLTNDTVVWQMQNLSEDADYRGGTDVNVADERANEEQALEKLAEELAQRIRALSTEGF